MAPSPRRSLIALAAAIALLFTGLATPAAAGTSAAYRFWGYFQQVDGQWQFAQTGPDGTNPADGSVEGWRFATAAADDTRFPRAVPTFDDICGDTEAVSGSKRVAVVVDYGRSADGDGSEPPAPRAACAVVPESGSGNDVLAAVAEVRFEEGLTCALDGYPTTGCGDAVDPMPEEAAAPDDEVELAGLAGQAATTTDADTADETADTAAAEDTEAGADDGGLGTGTWVAIVAVLLAAVIGGAALMRRRGAGD